MDEADQPVARKVDWGALMPSMGSNFRTHRLVKSADVWALRPTAGVVALAGVAFLFCAFGLLAGVLSFGVVPWWGTAVAVAAGTFFGAVGMLVLRRIVRPVFDLRRRRFVRGKDVALPFAEIHALQLLRHRVQLPNERDRYWTCELNLVQRDAARTWVVSHGDLQALRCDAGEIAGQLGLPLWDGAAGDGPPADGTSQT